MQMLNLRNEQSDMLVNASLCSNRIIRGNKS